LDNGPQFLSEVVKNLLACLAWNIGLPLCIS
jgi:hypothetical protein